jgi:hypothetical protein
MPAQFDSLLAQAQAALLGYGSLWSAIATMVVSMAVPLLIIIGKRAVKQIRAESFLRLEESFLKPNGDDQLDPQEALLDPTFDSVRCKYLDAPRVALPADAGAARRLSLRMAQLGKPLLPFLLYGFSVVVFAVIVAFFVDRLFIRGWLTVGPGCGASIQACLPLSAQILLLGLRPVSSPLAIDLAYAQNSAVMLAFAFAGAYLWCVLYLIRRVNNFDLTPYSFLLCGMRILLALAIALTVRHTVFSNAMLPAETGGETGIATYLAVLASFLLGFYPAAGMDYIMKRGQEFTVKRPHPDAAGLRHALPLDMIDGMSHFVQFRLEELEYEDVQNLATANPVLLYVETPYNILEIIDWIAQAQLITAVGPKKVAELRRMNVRTIFDLARIGDSHQFRRAILQILIEPEEFRGDLANLSEAETEAMFNCMFTSIADDLHVIRLARVWNAFYAVYQRDRIPDIATRGLLAKPVLAARWLEEGATARAALSATLAAATASPLSAPSTPGKAAE